MLYPRIIPCLLLKRVGLYKGKKFKNHQYVGDPINAIQIFNTKKADEIILLDITATQENRTPSVELIEKIADHCWTPFTIGGGINSLQIAGTLLKAGAEKICLNTEALLNPLLVRQIADNYGSQSIAVSIDVMKPLFGEHKVYTRCGQKKYDKSLFETIDILHKNGVGEILINSIDRDGTKSGYDHDLLKTIIPRCDVPVIACGGASGLEDIKKVIHETKATAAAVGSLFVFHGKFDAVLISYPNDQELNQIRNF